MDSDKLSPQLIDVYFLIQKFLSVGPLKETHSILVKELESSKILPNRLDWKGNEHPRSLAELEKHYPHVGPDYLLKICNQIKSVLDKDCPTNIKNTTSLLGAGGQSLLRSTFLKPQYNLLLWYSARRNKQPLADAGAIKTHNIVHTLYGREISGPMTRNLTVGPNRYVNIQLQRKTLGHLSAVYCLLFDRTGRYLVTGADDLLIKLWSSISGRLLSTFRGASSEITDIAINLENSLLAAGSIDRILRVWNLQTGEPVAVLAIHTGMITSVNFCPSSRWDVRYLISTSTDGSVAFWTYSHSTNGKAEFVSKPIQYQEKMRPGQAQMICSSFSPGGSFLATGSADHHVRVYFMHGDEGPHRILETQAHTDRVDSIQWSNCSLKFISGSKDGTAHIWNFECQQWRNHQLIVKTNDFEEDKKLKVTMVAWNCSDASVITAVSDFTLRIWRTDTATLERSLTGHTDEIYVLEAHPHDQNVVLSAGHDGQLFIWDIHNGTSVAHFMNNIEGQGYGAVFDAKWSPDGTMIAATDSHGHILVFGFGSGISLLKHLPVELFFHTDYRPLVRDSNNTVLDEQTQIPPHLMPPPFLVDVDGNPYPPMLQRLVPGREFCHTEQLVPNIVVGSEGNQEVIEGLPIDMDRLQGGINRDQEQELEDYHNHNDTMAQTGMAMPSRTPAIRRMGSIGLSQNGNFKWSKRVLVQSIKPSEIERARECVESLSSWELAQYRKEMRRRPVMINTASTSAPVNSNHKGHRKKKLVYHEESVVTDGEQEFDDASSSGRSEDFRNQDDSSISDSSSESSESSGYSDWVADHGVNLEPPTRSRRRQTVKNKNVINSISPTQRNEAKSANERPNNNLPKIPKGAELPEAYKPPEWLSETMPCKAPYFPQMGDEVVYFRQGHQMYVDAVNTKSVYDINPKELPWTKMDLKDHEFVKVVGIKYEIRPPRLCCLKLALLDSETRLTGNIFTIKYHDMADVLDFLVLKQVFDLAISRTWNTGDRFRCMIDACWWMGKIISKSSLSSEFPDSHFMSYEIQWDSGEYERMSFWDLEPIREDRLPENVGEPVPILSEEIQNILYHPQPEEWPQGDRAITCKRIGDALEQVMGLSIAEPFLVPVDLSRYPSYALIVEYPVDLSTIKARLENNFYRRITAVQFDVRYLATNAEKFNESHSVIVKHARIVTELCLRIIKRCSESFDVGVLYHQLMDTYQSSESETDMVQPGPSSNRTIASIVTRRLRHPDDWKHEARALLEALISCEDSVPFRTPVDHLKHPDYFQVIDTPMDLGTIKEDLLGGNYETPNDFCKDMRLIFQNSKNYNTNKRSRIYAMTIRISAMFEEHMGRILYNWKMARRRPSSVGRNLKRSRRKKLEKESLKESGSESDLDVEDGGTKQQLPKTSNRRINNTQTNGHISGYKSSEISDAEEELKPTSSTTHSYSSSEHSIYEPSSVKTRNSEYTNKRKVANNSLRKNGARYKSTSSENSDSDDSESTKTLSVLKEMNKLKSRGEIRRASTESDEIRTSLRRRTVKRPRYIEDSDSESVEVSTRTSHGNDTDENSDTGIVTSISSRGRVRRLTPRAKALLKR